MRFKKFLPLLIVGLLCCGCTPTTTLRHHSNYKDSIKSAKDAVIMPVVAEVNTVSFGGKKERMYDYETHIEGMISEIMLSSLVDKGLRVKLLRKKHIHEQHIGDIILSLRKHYNDAREELYSPLNQEHKKAFNIVKNIGNSAKALRETIGSDLLIFVDYVGAVKTTGARTLDFASTILLGDEVSKDADNSSLVIGLIDARGGDVIWMNLGVVQKDIYDCAFDNFSSHSKVEKETLTRLITLTLAPFSY